jgi:transcriptional regulator with PAS, ATPase and Fis domain
VPANPFDAPTRTQLVAGRPGLITFPKFRLKVVEGPEKGKDVVIDRRRATIGSAGGNELVLTDKATSRIHCEIVVDEKGYQLRDLDSKNGTLLDGVRIIAAYLKATSVITLGDTKVQFTPADENAEIALAAEDRFGKLVGPSLEMRALFAILQKVSPQDVTVLIEGESGTGKEMVAQEVHAHSPRKDEPFVVFDCGAVPENLMESELFGHVKGAFTGATSDRTGAMQLASGGTLFLDEIGELGKELQPKLLRALETKEVRPVGGSKSIQCDVRLVAATNRDLQEEVKRGHFREDLYFRLNVVRVRVAPLRRRKEDIGPLVEHFLRAAAAKGGVRATVPPDVIALLANHNWPGNVRELKNFVDRFRVFAPSDAAGAAQLLDPSDRTGSAGAAGGPSAPMRFDIPYKDAKSILVETFEVEYCRRLLERHGGNVSAASREAGIHRKYLEELVKKHALK